MEETGKVKGSPLAVGLAGRLYELAEDAIHRELSLSKVLRGLLIADSIPKDVQK